MRRFFLAMLALGFVACAPTSSDDRQIVIQPVRSNVLLPAGYRFCLDGRCTIEVTLGRDAEGQIESFEITGTGEHLDDVTLPKTEGCAVGQFRSLSFTETRTTGVPRDERRSRIYTAEFELIAADSCAYTRLVADVVRGEEPLFDRW